MEPLSRGFDAVVIGEPQRAFYGSQFGNTFPLFVHYGVPLWVPEVGGAILANHIQHPATSTCAKAGSPTRSTAG